MFSLIKDVIEQANPLITNTSEDEKLIIAIMTIAVLAVVFALLHSTYLLSAKLHSWLVGKEELVLPMLINSPSRLFILTAFSLWFFLCSKICQYGFMNCVRLAVDNIKEFGGRGA